MWGAATAASIAAAVLAWMVPAATGYVQWSHADITKYSFMVLIHRNPDSRSPHEEYNEVKPRRTTHHGAVLLSRSWVFTISSREHPLPSDDVPNITWPYSVVAATDEVMEPEDFGPTAEVKDIEATYRLHRDDEETNSHFVWHLIKVSARFSNKPGIRTIRILGLTVDEFPKDFREVCTALHWDVREKNKVRLVAGHFYTRKSTECGFPFIEYKSLCLSNHTFQWMCLADPQEVFVSCQQALAGVYIRISKEAQTCEDARSTRNLAQVSPAEIVTMWADYGAVNYIMCPSPEAEPDAEPDAEPNKDDRMNFLMMSYAEGSGCPESRRPQPKLLLAILTAVAGVVVVRTQ